MTESKGIGLTSEIIRIVSDQEIKVTAYQPYLNRSEASLIFPIPLYGKKYVIATYKPTVKAKFLILSHREHTHVNITFPKNTLYNGRIYNRSYPLNITLQRHQVFQFHSKSDLTGTIMQSNETVGIFSGNECANIPSQSSVCNTMFEQFLPASKLGQSYVLSTVSARNSGNIYRVVAAYDNTTVDIPSLSQTHTLNQGYYTEFELFYNEETVLVCDLPCLLVQFTIGGGSDSQRSDPFLTLVPAIEHYKSNYIVHIPSIATSQYQIYHNYLVVMIPASYRDGLLVNGNNLTGITWHTVFTNGSLDYACASIAITNATYTVSHVSDQVSFGLIQYGWSSQGIAYGFMGGIRENTTITTFFPPVITLQPDDQNNTLGQTIQLECTGISNPASTLVWLKNGIPIANTDDFKQVSSRGRDFCLGIYSQHPSANTPIPYILLTAYNQTANVIIFNNYFKSTVRRTLAPYETVAISISNFMVNDATGKTSKVFHVLSDHDITVKLYTIFKFTTDASLILPSSFYGKKYVAATYVPALNARILILAHQNDTTVSIRFPRGTYYNGQLYTRDRPLSIKLEQFQGFLYQINYDLTGTVIESDKGVAVITGNKCANVPVGVTFCDVLVQHLPPIEALGRNYILKALDGRKAYTVYRVIAAYDNTVVTKSYPFQTFILQRQGSFYEFQLLSGQGTNLVCDRPCLVVKYGVGITADSITGDPFIIAVPSVDDFDSNYIANVPRDISNFLSLFPVNYLQVIVEESFKEGLTLNGTAFPKVNWLPIRTLRNKNYMVASIPVGIGTYKLANNNSNATFGLLQYAWNSQSTSYGLSAGIKAKIFISSYPIIENLTESVMVPRGKVIDLQCQGSSLTKPVMISWLKNNLILSPNQYIITQINITENTVASQLMINPATYNHSDIYRCRVYNPHAAVLSSNIAIVIQDPPNPVRNLSISNITADSISVSWLPPKHDGYSPIMNYTVELLNDQSLLVIKNCSSSLIPTQCLTLTTSATFQGLKPFTVYYLRTWANNVIGNSTASTLQVKTDEAGIALGYNSSSIQINWKPPVITNGILGYRVYQWRSNQTIKTLKNSVLVYDGRSFQASATNLEADHLYYYQIIPYNIKYGYLGIASEFMNGTSHEDGKYIVVTE
ncbi:uncharacterized protein TRIADDRAFT_61038 [Trichoplax adhaerens]|uniref:Uncharacterized protein n=1 Tax=Trichoplax adhaerens TaxID=10228 RepID=B3S9V2_TRIAD|nr:hypothetical protein TRIADDRAFT_61038 [Trichoplax adhaerens]EDV20538.1 hypothetical protein TRIADDRAFT_61038 [Trichoplax adhaerens]|eukprot:XP_002116964.1 hypothetical protein TRIADDRAFT_61038 [Trichoplax adhaerens]